MDLQQAQSTSAPKVVVGRQLTLRDFARKKRTRARRSCDSCRRRKIKCDSNIVRPCTGCRNFGDDCEFLFEARKPGPTSKEYLETLEDRLKRLEAQLSRQQTCVDTSHAPKPNEPTRSNDIQPTRSQQTITTSSEIASIDSSKGYSDVSTSSAGLYMLYESLLQLNSAPGNISRSIKQTVGGDSHKNKHISAQSTGSYPGKQQLIQHIAGLTEDLADKMLHAYFDSVHPFAPILDKRSFLLQYYYQHPQPLDSYLFYAVCTAGSRVLPLENEASMPLGANWETVVSIGQQSRKEALKIARFAPYQRSNITNLQTLLILAMLGDNASEEAGSTVNWYLAGMAIRMAQDLELHLGSRQNHLPPGEIELRRRIAYVICIVDKMIAAAYDKPFAIKDEDFDVPVPSVYETPLEDDGFLLEERSAVPWILQETDIAIREHRPVYISFLRMISLSQMFGQVLTSLYSTSRQKKSPFDTFFIQSLDMALADWKRELQSSQYSMTSTICKGGVLNIFYNCIVLLLYRPLIMSSSENEPNEETSQLLNCCNMVSINIIDMVEMSENLGVRCIPWSMVDYALGQASMIFLYRSQSRNTDTRHQGYMHLLRCAKVYKKDGIMSRSRNAIILEQVAQQVTAALGMPPSPGSIIPPGQRRITIEELEQETDSNVQQSHIAIGTSSSATGAYSTRQQEVNDETAGDIQGDEASLLPPLQPLTTGIPLEVIDRQANMPMANAATGSRAPNINMSSNMALLSYYLTALELSDQPPVPSENERPYNG